LKYLLDTCVLSDFARGDTNTLERIKETSPDFIAVSSITVMEIEYGLALNAARARKLAPVMHALFEAVTIISYEARDAMATAALRAALRQKGRPIGAYDVLLAGCALARGLVLVTSNEKEFKRISGLTIENWRK
jgi:tRNA(fMet)-specific endonuclease VapC